MIGGVGWVNGVEVLVSASEATVQGGAINAAGVRKSARLGEVALENRLPAVHLIESAGADLPNQADIFVPGRRRLPATSPSARPQGLPTISLVFGSCTAGVAPTSLGCRTTR